jgi:CelD/BcsL family acetyltransferase involved in cellulose biosynthesis
MRIVAVDTFPPELDAVADASPRATFYHTGAWLLSLVDAYPKLRVHCLVAEDAARPVAFLPYVVGRRGPLQSLWSLPFGTYGGPVGDEAALAPLLAEYRRRGRARRVVELAWVDYHNHFDADGGEVETDACHVVDMVGGFDAVWRDRFDKPRRRRARRAEEAGVAVRRAAGEDDVHRFFEVYRSRLAGWESRGGHPESLFRSLLARGGERVRMYLAVHEGTVVGGHVNFYYKEDVTAWYGMASERGDQFNAGTLLYATAMREACAEGYRSYNLGASLGKASLIEFKRSLGGVSYEYRTVRHRSLAGRVVAALRRRGGER